MILGDSIKDENGNYFKMSGILPFKSKKSKLSVGYRYIKGLKDNLIMKQNQLFRGHEFHYWEIENFLSEFDLEKYRRKNKIFYPWEIKSWGTKYNKEGWSDKKLHASWIHLHFPSCPEAAKNFIAASQVDYSQINQLTIKLKICKGNLKKTFLAMLLMALEDFHYDFKFI